MLMTTKTMATVMMMMMTMMIEMVMMMGRKRKGMRRRRMGGRKRKRTVRCFNMATFRPKYIKIRTCSMIFPLIISVILLLS